MTESFQVIGVGGAGSNILNFLYPKLKKEVSLVAINTDLQDLKSKKAHLKIQIGKKITKGMGSGMNPELGAKAFLEQKEEVLEKLGNAELYLIILGLGGGTGSGAGPLLIKEIKEKKQSIVFAVCIWPFQFEGKQRTQIASSSLEEIKKTADSYLILDNNKLVKISRHELSIEKAFSLVEELIYHLIVMILLSFQGSNLVRVNFADVKKVIEKGGQAFFGAGKGKGERRARDALWQALKSPLLPVNLKTARSIFFTILGREDLALFDLQEASQIIKQEAGNHTKIIFGAGHEKSLKKGEAQINILVTGF